MTRARCEKSGRFLRAEISREKGLQQKPRERMKNLLHVDLSAQKERLYGDNEISQEALRQSNEANQVGVTTCC